MRGVSSRAASLFLKNLRRMLRCARANTFRRPENSNVARRSDLSYSVHVSAGPGGLRVRDRGSFISDPTEAAARSQRREVGTPSGATEYAGSGRRIAGSNPTPAWARRSSRLDLDAEKLRGYVAAAALRRHDRRRCHLLPKRPAETRCSSWTGGRLPAARRRSGTGSRRAARRPTRRSATPGCGATASDLRPAGSAATSPAMTTFRPSPRQPT
jgi:hypothetical protein